MVLNAVLDRAGLAVFQGRVIQDAQPPVTPDQLKAVAVRCRGPLPQGLIDLWSVSFGGGLDYELFAPLKGAWTWLSFTELFYPDSDGYHDLWGWIDHEVDLAEEAARARGETFDGLLDYLPFGGFEYLERLYVCTAPGANHGKVVAWIQGLPPAWGGVLAGEDTVIPVADDVPGLFGMLGLAVDPFTVTDGNADSGLHLAEAVDAVREADPKTAVQLESLIRQSIRARPETLVRA
jgi:hypothetical protein